MCIHSLRSYTRFARVCRLARVCSMHSRRHRSPSLSTIQSLPYIDESIDLVPNEACHVIEEIENIRSLVESKANELHLRESVLVQSVSNFNSDVSRGQLLIEQLAKNLLAKSEQSIEQKFSKMVTKLEKMTTHIDGQLRLFHNNELSRKKRSQRVSDVPPLEESCVVIPTSFLANFSSSCGRATAAAELLLQNQMSAIPFFQQSICDLAQEHSFAYFHEKFEKICTTIKIFEDNSNSRFMNEKRKIWMKRLSTSCNFSNETITLGPDHLGSTQQIDGIKTQVPVVQGRCILQLFTNVDVQFFLAGKIPNGLAQVVLSHEPRVSAILHGTEDLRWPVVLYALFQLDKRGLIAEKTAEKIAKEISQKSVTTWPQGLWCMMNQIVEYDGSTSLAIVNLYISIIDKSPKTDLKIWKNYLIDKIESGKLHEKVVASIKALIRAL